MSEFSYHKIKVWKLKEEIFSFLTHKMQPLLNVSKVWQTIPAGYLKKREPSKNIQETS